MRRTLVSCASRRQAGRHAFHFQYILHVRAPLDPLTFPPLSLRESCAGGAFLPLYVTFGRLLSKIGQPPAHGTGTDACGAAG